MNYMNHLGKALRQSMIVYVITGMGMGLFAIELPSDVSLKIGFGFYSLWSLALSIAWLTKKEK